MSQFYPYQLEDNLQHHARLGLVVLQTDETIEHDLHRMLPPEHATIYATRVPSSPEVTKETLAQMAKELPAVAGLLPNSFTYQAVGYGCTSGTAVIGAQRIEELVKQGCQTKSVSNPLSALIAACQQLGIKRLAFLSPYLESVSDHLRARVHEADIATPLFATFNEEQEANVARITGDSIFDAAVDLGLQGDCDAVFLSCTNLRTLDVISKIEAKINKPVLSSNQVLAWHLAQLAGLNIKHQDFGRLWM